MLRLKNLLRNIKNYKLNSLFVRNFILIFLVVMIPLDVLSLFFHDKNSKFMYNEISRTNQNYANTVRNITDTIMKESRSLTINTALLDRVVRYVSSPSPEDSPATATLIEYCNSYTNTLNYLHSIYIYGEESNTILTDHGVFDFKIFSDIGWYEEYQTINKEETIILTRAKNNYYPYFITIIHPIYPTDINKIGAVVVNINIQEMKDVFYSLDMNALSTQKFYITDNNDHVIYSEDQNDILKNIKDTKPLSDILKTRKKNNNIFESENTMYMFSEIKSQFFNWNYYCIVPMTSFESYTQSITAYLLILMTISLIVGLLGAFYLSIRTFRPIENIIELIDTPSNERMTSPLPSSYQNESTYILNHISKTLTTNEQLKEELDIRLMLLKHSQIIVLQSQINPHFLFNTLDTINWMAIDKFEGKNDISESLTVLGELFKLNIDTSNYLTDLKSELAYTKKYTEILKLRHKDIFTISWHIQEGIDECKIPRLVLQPLIENALYHGIKPTRRKGHIELTVEKENKDILIRVSDDGLGMELSKLRELSCELEEDYMFGGTHVGLKNINQRIKLIYGNEYGVKIKSDENGTVVTIIIPIT